MNFLLKITKMRSAYAFLFLVCVIGDLSALIGTTVRRSAPAVAARKHIISITNTPPAHKSFDHKTQPRTSRELVVSHGSPKNHFVAPVLITPPDHFLSSSAGTTVSLSEPKQKEQQPPKNEEALIKNSLLPVWDNPLFMGIFSRTHEHKEKTGKKENEALKEPETEKEQVVTNQEGKKRAEEAVLTEEKVEPNFEDIFAGKSNRKYRIVSAILKEPHAASANPLDLKETDIDKVHIFLNSPYEEYVIPLKDIKNAHVRSQVLKQAQYAALIALELKGIDQREVPSDEDFKIIEDLWMRDEADILTPGEEKLLAYFEDKYDFTPAKRVESLSKEQRDYLDQLKTEFAKDKSAEFDKAYVQEHLLSEDIYGTKN